MQEPKEAQKYVAKLEFIIYHLSRLSVQSVVDDLNIGCFEPLRQLDEFQCNSVESSSASFSLHRSVINAMQSY